MLKLLVVDDETQIREGIAKFADKRIDAIDEVMTAKNGEEALALFGDRCPDIVISDIVMPGMGGIEFVNRVFELNPDTKIILISGYSDFGYIKAGFGVQAVDYILKPIDTHELESALNKTVALCDRDNRIKNEISLSDNAMRERQLGGFLLNNTGYEELTKSIEGSVLPWGDTAGSVMCVNLDNRQSFGRSDITASYVFKLAENRIFSTVKHMVCLETQMSRCYITEPSALSDQFVSDAVDSINAELDNAPYSVSVGSEVGKITVRYLPKAYQHAKKALIMSMMGTRGYPRYTGLPAQKSDLKVPEALADFIKEGLWCQENTNIEKAITEAFSPLKDISAVDESDFFSFRTQIAMLLIRAAERHKPQLEYMWYDERILTEPSLMTTLDDLKKWLICISEQIRADYENSMCTRSQRTVRQVKDIAEKYYNTGICVQEIADKIGITANYLSTVFKMETGENLLEYITKYRMENACRLLLETDRSVCDIALSVGCSDQNYFSKVFKKRYGISPTKYREMRGRIDTAPEK